MLPPGCLSWKEEFRRLYFLAPWNGTQNANRECKTDSALKLDSKYKGGTNQSDPYCPENLSNAHYGKVKNFN